VTGASVQAAVAIRSPSSCEQICQATGWSYTKVNRSLAEGRKSFLEQRADPVTTPSSGGRGARAVTASASTGGTGSAAAEFGPEAG